MLLEVCGHCSLLHVGFWESRLPRVPKGTPHPGLELRLAHLLPCPTLCLQPESREAGAVEAAPVSRVFLGQLMNT